LTRVLKHTLRRAKHLASLVIDLVSAEKCPTAGTAGIYIRGKEVDCKEARW
jgi:hypothetical protein